MVQGQQLQVRGSVTEDKTMTKFCGLMLSYSQRRQLSQSQGELCLQQLPSTVSRSLAPLGPTDQLQVARPTQACR